MVGFLHYNVDGFGLGNNGHNRRKARCVFVRQNSKNCGSKKPENALAKTLHFPRVAWKSKMCFFAAKTGSFGLLNPLHSEGVLST